MSIWLFGIILAITLAILVLVLSITFVSKLADKGIRLFEWIYDVNLIYFMIAILVFALVLIGSYRIFYDNAKDVSVVSVKEVVKPEESGYMYISGGRHEHLSVCYKSENGKYSTYNIGNRTIEHDDGSPRIETHKYEWLFLTDKQDIIYNVD